MTMELVTLQGTDAVQPAEKNFWDLVEEWLRAISDEKSGKRAKKTRTLEAYRGALRLFADYLADEGISVPTRQNIIDWRNSLAKKHTARNPEKELSVNTRNLYITSVRVFFKWLSDTYGFVNIAAGIENWGVSREHKRGFLSCAEMKTLLQAVEPATAAKLAKARNKSQRDRLILQGKRDKAILATLMAGGLRTIEIARLRVSDVINDGGACMLFVLGKGRDDRESVKISRKAERLIREWMDARETLDVVSDNSPLFCSLSNNSFGEPLTSLSISRLVKEYLQAAGLKDKEYRDTRGRSEVKPVVAHSLRGSLATNAIRKGATLEQVKQQLRHRNVATTMIYLEEAEKFSNPCTDLVADEIF